MVKMQSLSDGDLEIVETLGAETNIEAVAHWTLA